MHIIKNIAISALLLSLCQNTSASNNLVLSAADSAKLSSLLIKIVKTKFVESPVLIPEAENLALRIVFKETEDDPDGQLRKSKISEVIGHIIRQNTIREMNVIGVPLNYDKLHALTVMMRPTESYPLSPARIEAIEIWRTQHLFP